MVRNRWYIGLLLLPMLFVQGCGSTYAVVEFEVLDPATVNFPDRVQRLLVMNRAPLTRKVFEAEDVEGLTNEQIMIVDTTIVNNLCRGVLNVLQHSPIERFHHPLWLSERRRDTTALEDLMLTKREVESLCLENGADAIISLEFYKLDLDVHVDRYEVDNLLRTKYYELATQVKWAIYLPGSPRPFDTYILSDTLYFTEVLDGNYIKMHTSASMISESCMRSGTRYGRYLVPAWNQASRVIFRGREPELRKAAAFTDRGDWESAYDLWLVMGQETDSSLAAKAFHNMAVYFELEDQLDSAARLVDVALDFDSLEVVRNYREELDVRLENRREIFQQIR